MERWAECVCFMCVCASTKLHSKHLLFMAALQHSGLGFLSLFYLQLPLSVLTCGHLAPSVSRLQSCARQPPAYQWKIHSASVASLHLIPHLSHQITAVKVNTASSFCWCGSILHAGELVINWGHKASIFFFLHSNEHIYCIYNTTKQQRGWSVHSNYDQGGSSLQLSKFNLNLVGLCFSAVSKCCL